MLDLVLVYFVYQICVFAIWFSQQTIKPDSDFRIAWRCLFKRKNKDDDYLELDRPIKRVLGTKIFITQDDGRMINKKTK